MGLLELPVQFVSCRSLHMNVKIWEIITLASRVQTTERNESWLSFDGGAPGQWMFPTPYKNGLFIMSVSRARVASLETRLLCFIVTNTNGILISNVFD